MGPALLEHEAGQGSEVLALDLADDLDRGHWRGGHAGAVVGRLGRRGGGEADEETDDLSDDDDEIEAEEFEAATSDPNRSRAPRAISRAVSSETAPCFLRVSSPTPRRVPFDRSA